jgi:hypothetical protein
MLSGKDLVGVKQPYLLILTFNEDKLDGIENITQRDTTLYFMNIFQFRSLRGQNEQSVEVWKAGTESSLR